MTGPRISTAMLLRLRSDRHAIAGELPELALQDARSARAAAEDTLCGRLRQAIHASHRPLHALALEAGIHEDELCDFLEGRRPLASDVLDRLTIAAGVVVTLVGPPN